MKIALTRWIEQGAGVHWLRPLDAVPDRRGVLAELQLDIPPFQRGVYYANAQYWPGGGCQVRPHRIDRLTPILPEGGQFLLLHMDAGTYVAILPIGCEHAYAWLSPREGPLRLCVGTHGTAPVRADVPVCAWAAHPEPYGACYEAWRQATCCPAVPARLREEKPLGEIFQHLGWCSWEEFHGDIDTEKIAGAMRVLEASPVPVRYVLLDDGHQDFADESDYFTRTLRSFGAHREKFPGGYGPIMACKSDKIRWLGYWTSLLAGMAGIDPVNNECADLAKHLMTIHGPGLVPKNAAASMRAFTDAITGNAAARGFDFMKVDFMSFALSQYAGAERMIDAPTDTTHAIDNPFQASWRLWRALEESVAASGLDLLNCNANSIGAVLQSSRSSTSRCSGDYSKGNRDRAREHLWESYAATPWLGQVTWGDHDMFHSCDPEAGRMMAVSKALSGGPVYLSDAPADLVGDLIAPLCDAAGRLLRPLAPGAPLPDSLFVDPITDCVPFRVVAPLPGHAAAIALYNLAGDDSPMEASVDECDYADAAAMIQPYGGRWTVPEGGLVFYDWYARTGGKLEGAWSVKLDGLEDRLVLLVPIRCGWAVIGRMDKYLAPAAVHVDSVIDAELVLTLHESGPLAVYCAGGPPRAEGLSFEPLGDALFAVDLPVAAHPTTIRIQRQTE